MAARVTARTVTSRGMVTRACGLLAVLVAVAGPSGVARAQALPGETFTLAWGGDVTPGSSYGLPPASGSMMLAPLAGTLG